MWTPQKIDKEHGVGLGWKAMKQDLQHERDSGDEGNADDDGEASSEGENDAASSCSDVPRCSLLSQESPASDTEV